jgi:hypothetical protein
MFFGSHKVLVLWVDNDFWVTVESLTYASLSYTNLLVTRENFGPGKIYVKIKEIESLSYVSFEKILIVFESLSYAIFVFMWKFLALYYVAEIL